MELRSEEFGQVTAYKNLDGVIAVVAPVRHSWMGGRQAWRGSGAVTTLEATDPCGMLAAMLVEIYYGYESDCYHCSA